MEKDFKLHSYTVGDFGGGTSKPKYFDKKGKEVPYKKTKWAKLKKKLDSWK